MTSSKAAEGQERHQSVEEKEEGYQLVGSMGHEITSHDSKEEAIEEEECAEKEAIEEQWRVWLRSYENQSNSNGDMSFYEKLQNLIYQSIQREYWEILREAYEKVPLARKATMPSSGNQTALHLLVGRSTAKVVEEVLRHVDEDDVKIKDEEGNTVLHAAAAKGIQNIDIYKLIHFKFQDLIEECNNKGKTALSLLTSGLIEDPISESWNTAVGGYLDLIKTLSITNLPRHSTPLHMAVTCSFLHREDAMKTFEQVKDEKSTLMIKDEQGNTALHLAAECAVFLEDLCKSMACHELINITNCKGETPLFIAARSVSINNFRNLCKYANPNTIDMSSGDDNTILHCALLSENLDIAYNILQNYSSFRSRMNSDDLTPLKILAKIPHAFRSRTPLTMVEQIIYSCIWVVDLEEPWKTKVDYCRQELSKCFNIVKRLMTSGELVGKIKSIKRRNMLAYKIMEKLLLKYEASCEDPFPLPGNATVLIAAKKGITEMVEGILRKNPEAIKCTRMTDSKNAMLVAIENRQADVYEFLTNLEKKGIEIPKWRYGGVTDHEGNNALHIAATKSSRQPWGMPTTLQLLWEIKWYNYVRDSMPPHFSQARNKEGKTPAEVFNETHEDQIKSLEGGGEWVNKTSQSCSVVASLIAAVTFAASTTFPGGNNNEGAANFLGKPAFSIFVISTFVALSLSLTSLIMFLTILITPYHNSDALGRSLPGKLIAGISALLGSIGATLISFWAAHMFYLQGKLKAVALPIYIAACLPFLFTVKAQIPFYTNLVLSVYKAKPRPWYRKFIT